MKGISHLAALVRFAVASNPLVLLMPMPGLALMAFEVWQGDDFRFQLVNMQSVFSFLMLPQLALVLFAPGLWSREAAAANPLEFLLTRPIDRRSYLRAMTVTYLALGVLPALCGLVFALSRPTLEVMVLQDAERSHYLSAFSGSYVATVDPAAGYRPPTVVIPHGRVLVAALDVVDVVALAMLVLALLLQLMRTLRRPLVTQLALMAPAGLVFLGLPFWTLANGWVLLAAPRVAALAAVVLVAAFAAHRVYERWFDRLEVASG
jgi:hypothetical protein